MFAVLEGLDQCGKGTQAKLLIARLMLASIKPHHFPEPGGTDLSREVRQVVMHKKDIRISTLTETLLYSASRAQLQDEEIRDLRRNNAFILLERYFYSTIAYQGYGRGVPIHKINLITHDVIECEVPDKVFLLDISVEEMYRRRQLAGIQADRIESAGIEFYNDVRNGYLFQARQNVGLFQLINATQSIAAVHNEIWTTVCAFTDIPVETGQDEIAALIDQN